MTVGVAHTRRNDEPGQIWKRMRLATPSGFEPPISTVTGWRVWPLHYGAATATILRGAHQAVNGGSASARVGATLVGGGPVPRRPTTRRTATRRSLPPRPPAAPGTEVSSPGTPGIATRPVAPAMSRPARLVEREAPYLISELKRVAFVSGTCLGLLLLLTAIDHLR